MGLGKRGLGGIWISIIVIVVVLAAVILFVIFSKEEIVMPPNPINVQCQSQCDTGSKIGFCDVERRVTENLITTCQELSANPSYAQYGVQSCPSISCISVEESDQTCVTGLGGTWETPTENGGCEQYGDKIRRELSASDNPPIAGQICCK